MTGGARGGGGRRRAVAGVGFAALALAVVPGPFLFVCACTCGGGGPVPDVVPEAPFVPLLAAAAAVVTVVVLRRGHDGQPRQRRPSGKAMRALSVLTLLTVLSAGMGMIGAAYASATPETVVASTPPCDCGTPPGDVVAGGTAGVSTTSHDATSGLYPGVPQAGFNGITFAGILLLGGGAITVMGSLFARRRRKVR